MFINGAGGKLGAWALKARATTGQWPGLVVAPAQVALTFQMREGGMAYALEPFKLEWSHCPVMSFWLCPKIYLLLDGLSRDPCQTEQRDAVIQTVCRIKCCTHVSRAAPVRTCVFCKHRRSRGASSTQSHRMSISFRGHNPFGGLCRIRLFHEVLGLQNACSCTVARVQLCLNGTQRICFLSE